MTSLNIFALLGTYSLSGDNVEFARELKSTNAAIMLSNSTETEGDLQ